MLADILQAWGHAREGLLSLHLLGWLDAYCLGRGIHEQARWGIWLHGATDHEVYGSVVQPSQ